MNEFTQETVSGGTLRYTNRIPDAGALLREARREGLHIQLFCSEEHLEYYGSLGFERFAPGMKIDGREPAPETPGIGAAESGRQRSERL
ncbi:hypothetical protein QWJ34_10665 [Saccharibacillus sp. CPCC 101409]|uniref:hypothetical protein n=1 Tax=Saccharibacillus sp. CPCC 101409 TaxID=3058041 RepID=UPI002672E9DD|nr:hypothetical protein [Saccharibacillus sp. CPCC 101409]MDO3410223.1 hypothetical protein [Saccharibacillus sp. CPCC 101409]